MEKSMEPLGIKINTARGGGIFVSSVSEKSLAAQAGLEVGDQLLEVKDYFSWWFLKHFAFILRPRSQRTRKQICM